MAGVGCVCKNLTSKPDPGGNTAHRKYALVLLVLSLACAPLNTLFGFRQALTVRRAWGCTVFFMPACTS
jgi:DMSO/TMAO reductase YedYZ heme-binding membrane subunit